MKCKTTKEILAESFRELAEIHPAKHDGVAFEDLPDDFECPLCGVGKDMFTEE